MERDPMEMALSTDIVLGIVMAHLKVIDLLSCRLVSNFWNKTASSVLRKRSTMVISISEEGLLMELEECMRQSSDFPFAGLAFDQPWLLNSDGAMEFFKKYGARFTSLRLDTELELSLDRLAPFIHHLPRLSILQVGQVYGGYSPDSGSTYRQEVDDKILDLSSVRILNISSGSHVAQQRKFHVQFTSTSAAIHESLT